MFFLGVKPTCSKTLYPLSHVEQDAHTAEIVSAEAYLIDTMVLYYKCSNIEWKQHSAKHSNEEWEIFAPFNPCSDPLTCMQLSGLIYYVIWG